MKLHSILASKSLSIENSLVVKHFFILFLWPDLSPNQTSQPNINPWIHNKKARRRISVVATSSAPVKQVGEHEVEQRKDIFKKIAPIYDNLNDFPLSGSLGCARCAVRVQWL